MKRGAREGQSREASWVGVGSASPGLRRSGRALAALAAHADDPSAWLKDRQARFAAFHAAHPHPDAEIARIKAKTAALLAAAPPMDPAVDKPPLSWKATDKPEELWDGADLPEMIVVPAGEYSMGSPTTEYNHQSYEAPLHRVRVGYSFAVGKYPITVGEFARFVAETGYDAGDSCFTSEGGQQPRSGRSWRNPSFPQTSDHPAVCLNWNDAQAYVSWLVKKTGHAYRLLSEAEYEYVNRAGSQTSYWWGEDAAAACLYANGADLDALTHFPQMRANTCHDGYVFTSPVGSSSPTPSAFMTSPATPGPGWPTAGTRPTSARPRTDRPIWPAIAASAPCAAGPGAPARPFCARPNASAMTWACASTITDCASPGLFRPRRSARLAGMGLP